MRCYSDLRPGVREGAIAIPQNKATAARMADDVNRASHLLEEIYD
jgi:hypothetical protein